MADMNFILYAKDGILINNNCSILCSLVKVLLKSIQFQIHIDALFQKYLFEYPGEKILKYEYRSLKKYL